MRTRLWSTRSSVAIAALVTLAAISTPLAPAATGGAPTAAGPPPAGSASGSPALAPSAGTISLLSAAAAPRKSFYYGLRYPRLSFSIASGQAQNDLRIDVVGATGASVRTFFRNDVAPSTEVRIRWDGIAADGRPAPGGRYSFGISSQTGAPAATSSAEAADLGFALYGYAFPVLGAHDFGAGDAQFGAGRSGHTHQGQDVMAACGLPLVAARGGQVQYSGYQAAAGNYVVIDGKGTALDFMYAHLEQPSPLSAGDPVRTGQPIGVVGETGNAQGCHLHFEIWAGPGWYEGGGPLDPLPYLARWDLYS